MSDQAWRDAVLDLAREFSEWRLAAWRRMEEAKAAWQEDAENLHLGAAGACEDAAHAARGLVDRLDPKPGVPGVVPPPRPTREEAETTVAAAVAIALGGAADMRVVRAVLDDVTRRGWLRLREEAGDG